MIDTNTHYAAMGEYATSRTLCGEETYYRNGPGRSLALVARFETATCPVCKGFQTSAEWANSPPYGAIPS